MARLSQHFLCVPLVVISCLIFSFRFPRDLFTKKTYQIDTGFGRQNTVKDRRETVKNGKDEFCIGLLSLLILREPLFPGSGTKCPFSCFKNTVKDRRETVKDGKRRQGWAYTIC